MICHDGQYDWELVEAWKLMRATTKEVWQAQIAKNERQKELNKKHAEMVDHWLLIRKLEEILKMKQRTDEPQMPVISENLEEEMARLKNMVNVQNDVKWKNEDLMIEQIEDVND